MARRRRKKKTSPAKVIISLILIIAAGILGWIFGPKLIDEVKQPAQDNSGLTTARHKAYVATVGEIEYHFIDVGQGDSILIETPDGAVLVDAGPNSAEDELKKYLDVQGVTEITYAVFTHMDEDHIGNADMVVNTYDVDTVLMPNQVKTTNDYKGLLEAIDSHDTKLETVTASGGTYSVGNLKLNVLAPNAESYSSSNNYSIVLKAVYGETSVLLTGDAETKSEKEILGKYSASQLKSDLLKVGHHGSDSSTSKNFLEAVDPTYAVIMCGVDNKFGHPKAETVEKLEAAKVVTYRTDELGSIIFVSNGKELTYDGSTGKKG